jgi:hypothetical protein
MIQRYRIAADELPLDEPLGLNLRRAFVDFGYGECLGSFLRFGVFKIRTTIRLFAGTLGRDLRHAGSRGNPPHRVFH